MVHQQFYVIIGLICAVLAAKNKYHYVSTKLSWNDANNYCLSEFDATLAIIKNDMDTGDLIELCRHSVCWIDGIKHNRDNWEQKYCIALVDTELERQDCNQLNAFICNKMDSSVFHILIYDRIVM